MLVSNQHYRDLSGDELERAWEERPIVCKLADLGEGHSVEVQTNTVLKSQTQSVNHGTPVYMAPEAFVKAIRLPSVNFEDLRRVDIWALGMLFYTMVNPSA